ncbi:DUF6519 domain-containing protein [Granulicella sp. dw_53]|uniref:DUF6519 domain-containing protein n=1 Tax=Granulicella sp. dw_53 TaxID=2719792 RepID=UPI001BD29C17|nr:DUF6519 domain-containing protein [Granulicella sp. dw_53]
MKGDFSRIRFNPKKNYTAVLEQQGRVALDADANEQSVILEHIRDTEVIDMIGPFGGPIHDAGFAISASGSSISIGAGRYYVHGILCESPAPIDYSAQPFLLGPMNSASDLLNQLSNGKVASLQLFLEVWQRLVTSLEDPCLLEPALGQADTTVRRQTVWRVVASLAAPQTQVSSAIDDLLNRPGLLKDIKRFVTVVDERAVLNSVSLADRATVDLQSSKTTQAALDCCASMTLPAQTKPSGRLTAQTNDGGSDCSCEPTPSAGFRGLENQLYRIEIHHGGTGSQATFKWSRENGSVVTAVTDVFGSDIKVDSLGPDANLGFSPGQWVELTDDLDLFGIAPNQPGDLFQIQSTTPERRTITTTAPASKVDRTKNARLRRWDQNGATLTATGIPLSPGTWIGLENGIQIQFTEGDYASGDFWLIPARTASGAIDWPPCGSDDAAFQQPHRTPIYRAPLACIHWDPKSQQPVVQDCRSLFSPLTELVNTQSKALHVTAIDWNNDDVITLDQLAARGLTITLNSPPTSTVDPSIFSVVLEAALARADQARSFVGAGVGFQPTVLHSLTVIDSQITVKSNQIFWNIPFANAPAIQWETLFFLDALLLPGAPFREFGRIRIKLAGRNIFAGNGSDRLYLDGAVLGTPATRTDGTSRMDLQLPSTNDEKASDFESWFFVAPTLNLTSLTINNPAVQVNVTGGKIALIPPGGKTPVTLQATLQVTYPAIAATTVALTLTGVSGVGSIVNVQPSVVIGQNQSAVSFPINVIANPGSSATGLGNTLTFTLTASLVSAVSLTSSQAANFTLTGTPPPIEIPR